MISCDETRKHPWDDLERPQGAVADHLRSCRTCRGEAEFLGRLVNMLSELRDEDIPLDVRTRLEAALSER